MTATRLTGVVHAVGGHRCGRQRVLQVTGQVCEKRRNHIQGVSLDHLNDTGQRVRDIQGERALHVIPIQGDVISESEANLNGGEANI